MPVPKEKREPGRNRCYLCLLFTNSFSRVTGKHQQRGQDRGTPSQLLNKGRGNSNTHKKKKKAFSRKGSLALCQQQKTYVSNKLKMLYNYLISIDHSSTHVHLFRAGESKKMKGQLACTWTAFESQDVQTFYPRKYKTEILPDLWTVTPRNIKIPRSEVIFQFGAIFSVSGSSIFQHFLF